MVFRIAVLAWHVVMLKILKDAEKSNAIPVLEEFTKH